VIRIREATLQDAPRIAALLAENRQSTHAVLATGTRYWLGCDDDQPVGTLGLELGRDAVLLRSAAVLPAWRGRGIGAALTQVALAEALRAGCRRAYRFSTGAGRFWARLGFRAVPVAELLAALDDPQVRQDAALGRLSTGVALRRDLAP
jgi:N-acetylglutamate synthase-like GNAT family acetyltransferase